MATPGRPAPRSHSTAVYLILCNGFKAKHSRLWACVEPIYIVKKWVSHNTAIYFSFNYFIESRANCDSLRPRQNLRLQSLVENQYFVSACCTFRNPPPISHDAIWLGWTSANPAVSSGKNSTLTDFSLRTPLMRAGQCGCLLHFGHTRCPSLNCEDAAEGSSCIVWL